MEINGTNKLDNLSTLSARLREIEDGQFTDEDGTAFDAREDLVDAVKDCNSSWYRFGEALVAYKAFYVESRGWMKAAEIIGQAIHRDERTVRRVLEGYERASQIPAEAINELEVLGLDPAAKRNEPIIENLLKMPRKTVESEPKLAVEDAVNTAAAMKVNKKAAKKLVQTVDASGENRCTPLTREERLRRDTRLKIRTALSNVPDGRKLAELKAALEEEMYEAWGEREPTVITLTPRPSALTLGGLRKEKCAA
jgi:hypothetical protein